jgi:hypothetical protein
MIPILQQNLVLLPGLLHASVHSFRLLFHDLSNIHDTQQQVLRPSFNNIYRLHPRRFVFCSSPILSDYFVFHTYTHTYTHKHTYTHTHTHTHINKKFRRQLSTVSRVNSNDDMPLRMCERILLHRYTPCPVPMPLRYPFLDHQVVAWQGLESILCHEHPPRLHADDGRHVSQQPRSPVAAAAGAATAGDTIEIMSQFRQENQQHHHHCEAHNNIKTSQGEYEFRRCKCDAVCRDRRDAGDGLFFFQPSSGVVGVWRTVAVAGWCVRERELGAIQRTVRHRHDATTRSGAI